MLIMDSGVGGLSVVRALRAIAPSQPLFYLADTAGFPYGHRAAEAITDRATHCIRAVAHEVDFQTVVLACNTLSTLCLEALRAALPYRFVGTVPAIKVAAAMSQSRRFTLLATPNTVHSAYTQQLIANFAQDCVVDCYGAPDLAAIAEAALLGDAPDPAALRQQLAPVFHDDANGKTDAVILGCTHYPLLLDALKSAAAWEVRWIDSSDAIARQALRHATLPMANAAHAPLRQAFITSPALLPRYAPLFAAEGFPHTAAIGL